MNKSILIIDDEAQQAKNLKEALSKRNEEFRIEVASTEEEINAKINDFFFMVAIVDLRMDKYKKDGVDFIKEINEINPYAVIIAVSAYESEYEEKLKNLLLGGNIFRFCTKKSYNEWVPELEKALSDCFSLLEEKYYMNQQALLSYYNDAKNEMDTYKKGKNLSILYQCYSVTWVMGESR